MCLWEYPCLKGESWGKWCYRNKIPVFTYYTAPVRQLLPMIFEYKDIFESLVFSQIHDPVPECPEYILNLLFRHIFKRSLVIRSLYNYLVGTYTIHLVKDPLTSLVQCPFYLEGG